MKLNSVYQGDCLKLMKEIKDESIDLILCDLPYGTTNCNWDSIIPFEPLWEQYKRIAKEHAAIVLTASQPFTSALVMSQPKLFRHSWIWHKTKASNYAQAKIGPFKNHEDVLVFGKKGVHYYPQMVKGSPYFRRDTSRVKEDCFVTGVKKYGHVIDNKGTRFPLSVQTFKNSNYQSNHPTQKPVALFEYMILSYSREGDTVLDNCAGSGTTGVAAKNRNRNFILIEQESRYIEMIYKRLDTETRQLRLCI